jgi:large subunit ribosomal protein L18
MNIRKKHQLATIRRARVRRRVAGTAERPRMAVKFTGTHIYVQFVDDQRGVTLAAASTRQKGLPAAPPLKANVASARVLGGVAAEAAKAAGITQVVFDRGAAAYHGKVAALAEAARAGGLKF